MSENNYVEFVDATRQKFNILFKDNIEKGSYDQRDLDRLESNDVIICRYLIHSRGDVDKTASMIHTSLQWRKELGLNDLKEESFPKSLHEIGGIFYHNHDKNDHVILHIRASKHKKEASYALLVQKYLAWKIEQQFLQRPDQRIVVLFDMIDAGMSNVDINFIKFMISCFATFYPAFLEYLLILEMPWVLNAIWKIIKNLLDAEQQKYVLMVKKSEIIKYIARDQLFLHMGGTDDYQYSYIPTEDSGIADVLGRSESDLEKSFTSSDEFSSRISNSNLRQRLVLQNGFPKSTSFDNVSFMNDKSSLINDKSSSAFSKKTLNTNSNCIYKGSLANISPPETLTFHSVDTSKDSMTHIFISNTSKHKLLFKVRTTTPETFKVKPIAGVIDVNESTDIAVSLLAGHLCDPYKDRFLVMLISLKDESTYNSSAVWKSTPKDSANYMEHRLTCETEAVPLELHTLNGRKTQITSSLDSSIGVQLNLLMGRQEDLSRRFEKIMQIQIFIVVLLVFILLSFLCSK